MKIIDKVLDWMLDLAFKASRQLLKIIVIAIGVILPCGVYLFALDKWGYWWGLLSWTVAFLLTLTLVIAALVDGARVGERS